MGYGILGETWGELFGNPEQMPDEMTDLGITGSAYQDLFSRDPIETLPQMPYQFAVEDPAQDPFQFPFQFPNEQANETGYGAQRAPVDMPENLLQEVYDPLQEIAELNPANPQSKYYAGESLIENAADLSTQIVNMLIPESVERHPLNQLVNYMAEQLDRFEGSYDFTAAQQEQAQTGFADLLNQPSEPEHPQPLEDLRSASDVESFGVTEEPGITGTLGEQYQSPEEIAGVMEKESQVLWSDLREENDFAGSLAESQEQQNREQGLDEPQPITREAPNTEIMGQLGEQYATPEQLAQVDMPDQSFDQWNDLRLADEGEMGYVAPESPNAHGELGAMYEQASPVVHAIENQEATSIDTSTTDIADGTMLELNGLDVLPTTSDMLDLAAELIAE